MTVVIRLEVKQSSTSTVFQYADGSAYLGICGKYPLKHELVRVFRVTVHFAHLRWQSHLISKLVCLSEQTTTSLQSNSQYQQ